MTCAIVLAIIGKLKAAKVVLQKFELSSTSVCFFLNQGISAFLGENVAQWLLLMINLS